MILLKGIFWMSTLEFNNRLTKYTYDYYIISSLFDFTLVSVELEEESHVISLKFDSEHYDRLSCDNDTP